MKARNFSKKLRKAMEVKKDIPDVVAKIAKNQFEKSFRDQGFTDRGLSKWEGRKGNNKGRAILVKTSNLKRSIFVKSANFDKITIASTTDYGYYHNEGVGNLPKRQFMGNSKVLNDKLKKKIESMIKDALLKK
jgi:phage gpG-like protein